MGVPTLLLLYMSVKLGQEWCGDSHASAKVRVDLPSSKVRFTAQFKGQVHCPVQRSGSLPNTKVRIQVSTNLGSV